MKIDFSAILVDFYDKQMTTKDSEGEDEPLTLAVAAVTGLMRPDQKDDGKARFDLYSLAKKVGGGGIVEIEPKEAETIKTRIGMAYGQVVVGPSWKLLNG